MIKKSLSKDTFTKIYFNMNKKKLKLKIKNDIRKQIKNILVYK